MKLLDQLQRRFGRFALPHVTEGLIACQVLAYLLDRDAAGLLGEHRAGARARAARRGLAAGHVPLRAADHQPGLRVLLLVSVLSDGHGIGEHLGRVPLQRLFAGGLGGHGGGVVPPAPAPASPGFLQGSVFLAFAYLYPDFQLLLFFILPVKVKWLAMLAWIGYFSVMVFGDLDDAVVGGGVGVEFFPLLLARHRAANEVRALANGSPSAADPPGQRAPPHVRRLRGNEPERSEDELSLLLEVCRHAVLLRRTHPRARARDCGGERLRLGRHAEPEPDDD